MKKYIRLAAAALAAVMLLSGCGEASSSAVKLDPQDPVNITIWHYYNGAQQLAFDKLVEEFNDTEGRERGIYVEAHSQGNVSDLETKVLDAFNKTPGSEVPPDIFSSYADTAYAIEQMGQLVDLGRYMTEEEISEYVPSFIEEGRIGANGELKIFPTAKATEIMLLNKTEWDAFCAETGVTADGLSTKEKLVETARTYYEWTDAKTPDVPGDGKSFYGTDAVANLFIIGAMQQGVELFSVDKGQVTLHPDKDAIRRIWDFYYVPFVNGWFGAYGRFRSDDVKIGELVAFTGSTSSGTYFPDVVETAEGQTPIECLVAANPMFENSQPYAVQQGAGMVVTKSTPQREYAAVEFLKWFTREENNIQFSCTSGYLPVKSASMSVEKMDQVLQEQGEEMPVVNQEIMSICFDMTKDTTLYTNKAFNKGTEARKVVEYNLSDKAAADRAEVVARVQAGQSQEEAVAEFVTDEAFDAWYQEFCSALENSVA